MTRRTKRNVRHRDRGWHTLNERKYFYLFSGGYKLAHGIQPTIAECNALERFGEICKHHCKPKCDILLTMKVKNKRNTWKNIHAHMRRDFLMVLLQNGTQTPYAVGKNTGYSQDAVRTHLTYLEASGFVEMKTLWRKRLFTITEKGRELLEEGVVKNE